MSGVKMSELPTATPPITGSEEVALRIGTGNARLTLAELAWFMRNTPIAQLFDGSATGGNARGAKAVDLQTSRSTAQQVASGSFATIAGGDSNTASGGFTTVGGGSANVATGSRATVAGGLGNAADGLASWCPGGERAGTRGHVGRGAWSASRFSANGDAQSGEFLVRALTTDATPTRATSNAVAPSTNNTVNLPNNGTYRLKLMVVAQQTGGSAGTVGDCAAWEPDVLIKRGANAAATVFVGGTTDTNPAGEAAIAAGTGFAPALRDAAAAGWRLTLAADTTNGGLEVTVTGEANKTIRWVARVQSVEVTA